jgi:hypothetical protein
MDKMSNLENAIRDLVAANEGFWIAKTQPMERRTGDDHSSIMHWGSLLKASQEYLGIIIVDPEVIDANVQEAQRLIPSGGQ